MAEPDLDTIVAGSRQRADDRELQREMSGHYFAEPSVQLQQEKSPQVLEEDQPFVQPENRRSNEEIDTLLREQQPLREAPAERQLVAGVRKAFDLSEKLLQKAPDYLDQPQVQALGLGLTTGGVVTGQPELALPGLAIMGMAKVGSFLRQRFQVEGIVERALNPAPLAERVMDTLNTKTAVVTDAEAATKAAALLRDGGVSRETLANYAPGTSLLSPGHSLAAQEIVTTESRTFLDLARLAVDTNDAQLADQALAQFARLVDPASTFAGAVTTTAQTLRVASSEDVKAMNLLLERSAKSTQDMSPLDQLRMMLSDPATDPAKQGKSLTQSFRNVMSQAKEIVGQSDDAGAQVLLHEIKATVEEAAQLDMFVTPSEVKEAQKVIKNVTAQHIIEANQGAARKAEEQFALTPTGPTPYVPKQTTFLLKPIKAGDQLTDDQLKEFNARLAHKVEQFKLTNQTAGGKPVQQPLFVKPIKPGQQLTDEQLKEYNIQVAEAAKEKFKLTPTQGGGAGKGKQTDLVADEEANRLATIKEHQAQDLRVSEGTSVFSPKREPFKLTPPPGGARAPKKPKQLDLLTIIAKEPEPEQLALEMAKAIEHPELSKQFLSMIRKAQDAITFGKTEEVGKALEKIQTALTPKTPAPGTVSQPSRLTTQEKKAIQSFLASHADAKMSDIEMLKALVADPALQPEALITAINNAKNPTWRGAWQYLIINSMLSPTSDFVNFTATASMVPVHIAARTVAGRMGQVSKVLGGRAGVIVGEDEAMLHGLYASFWDAVKLAGRVARTNIPEIGPAAIRETQLGQNPLSSQAVFGYSPTARRLAGITTASDAASSSALSRAGLVSRAIDLVGITTGLPGRFMLTGDQFIQHMAMNAEQHALVYRKATEQALREGLTEKEFYQAYQPLWRDVTKHLPSEIREKGEAFSLEVSLNNALGPIGQSFLNARETTDRYTGVLGTIAMPFFKTLVNSTKATWEFSPLGPSSQALGLVAKQFRSDMFGADPVKRDLALGKWAVGTIMMSSLLAAAVNGRIRGRGPDNKELLRQSIEAQGLPDSIVINADDGTSIQVNRLGIVGNMVGMAADVADVWLQADDLTRSEIAQLLTTAFVGNLAFDFLQNSSGVIHALANGVKTKQDLDLLAKSLINLVPLAGTGRSVERILATEEDPVLIKDAKMPLEKILARFPGYDSLAEKYGLPKVPVLRNQWGYAIRQPHSAYGTEWFNPLFVSHPSQHEGLAELAAIELELGVAIQQPDRNIGQHDLLLTNEEYDMYQQLAGEQWEVRSLAILPTLRRADIPDQRKRDLIETQLREARATATRQLFGEEPSVVRDIAELKRYLGTTLRSKKTPDRGTLQPVP